MRKVKKTSGIIEVDEDFFIEVDSSNWVVWRRVIISKGETKGEEKWIDEAFCHDLSAALKNIIRLKSEMNVAVSSISDYLSWHDTTYHSIADRVLRQRKELSEALELNKVM